MLRLTRTEPLLLLFIGSWSPVWASSFPQISDLQSQIDRTLSSPLGQCYADGSKPICSIKTLTNNCAAFDRNKPTLITPSGMEIRNPGFVGPASANSSEKTPTLADTEKLGQLNDFAKQKIIELIAQGKPREQWTTDQKNMVKRVETVQIKNASDEITGDFLDPSSIRGAYYPQLHTIRVPSELVKSPSTYLMVIAHEIAHSIDPCNVQLPLFSVDRKTLSQNLSKTRALTDPDYLSGVIELRNRTRLTQYFSIRPEEPLWNHKKNFLERKMISQETEPLSNGSTTDRFENYPFAKIYQCLGASDGANFVTDAINPLRTDSVTQQRAKEIHRLERTSSPRAFIESLFTGRARKKEIENDIQSHPDCGTYGSTKSQAGEALSDWVSSKVLGAYQQELASESLAKKVEGIFYFSYLACNTVELNASKQVHPPTAHRIDRIFLSEPRVAAALGCEIASYRIENCGF